MCSISNFLIVFMWLFLTASIQNGFFVFRSLKIRPMRSLNKNQAKTHYQDHFGNGFFLFRKILNAQKFAVKFNLMTHLIQSPPQKNFKCCQFYILSVENSTFTIITVLKNIN